MTLFNVTCAHCGAVYDHAGSGILTHPEPECEAVLLAKAAAVSGERAVEVIPCADAPYTCDGFDPADWPEGEIPDFSLIREWERRPA